MENEPVAPRLRAEPLAGTSGAYAPGRRLNRYITAYSLATLGITLLWGGVLGVLLPLHVQQLEFANYFTGADVHVDLKSLTDLKAQIAVGKATANADQDRLIGLLAQYEAAKASGLSLVQSVGIISTMLVQPLVGMLSDRTRSRWGRRAPYIAAGSVAGAAMLLTLSSASTVGWVILLWSFVQLLGNVAQGPLAATVADRVPHERMGTVSAATGLVAYLGAILGALAAGILFGRIGLGAYSPFVAILAALPLMFLLVAPDRPSTDLPVAHLTFTEVCKSYGYALKYPDFRWAWIAKVLLYLGFALATTFSLYMLQSYVQPSLSAAEAARIGPLLQIAGLPFTLISMVVAGRLSDKTGRRKPFVIGASLVMAASFLIPLSSATLPAMFAQAMVMGVGFGAFLVVDQALFVDVLPDKQFAGRDLGMSTLGQNVGQALGPVLAGLVVSLSGGTYTLVWPAAAVFVLVAALVVTPIKTVR